MKVYLGGSINGCSDEEAHDWRELVKPILAANGHSWADPMDRDYRGHETEPGIAACIVEGDKADIESCDVALFNCSRISWGTAMEILWSWQCEIQTIVVLPKGITPSPWLIYHGSVVHGPITDIARCL